MRGENKVRSLFYFWDWIFSFVLPIFLKRHYIVLHKIGAISSKIKRFYFLTFDFEYFWRIVRTCYNFDYFQSRKWNNIPCMWPFEEIICFISFNIDIISETFYEASTSILSKFLWHFLCHHVFVFTFLSVIY